MTAMTTTESDLLPPGRRAELSAFLRSRRARILPEDVGLKTGPRRRTPGLRREELAALAGVGVTWYTRLEQGRPINVSSQVIDAIAQTLRLDSAEREHLYRLAEVPSVPLPSSSVELEPAVQVVLDGMESLPAAVYSSRYDVLAWNDLYAKLFPGLVGPDPASRNVLWNLFAADPDESPWVNRDEGLPQMVATFRAEFARHANESEWTRFVEQLGQVSEEFTTMWASHDVAGLQSITKIYRHPAVGELAMTTASFPVCNTREMRMVVYTPLDEESRLSLERLSDLDVHGDRRLAVAR